MRGSGRAGAPKVEKFSGKSIKIGHVKLKYLINFQKFHEFFVQIW